jgi:hypothetical protein
MAWVYILAAVSLALLGFTVLHDPTAPGNGWLLVSMGCVLLGVAFVRNKT